MKCAFCNRRIEASQWFLQSDCVCKDCWDDHSTRELERLAAADEFWHRVMLVCAFGLILMLSMAVFHALMQVV